MTLKLSIWEFPSWRSRKESTRNHEVAGSIPGQSMPGQGSGIAMSCGVGHRCGLDPELQWLWRRTAAVALIRPLAWEPPHAAGAALKSKNK